MNDFELDRSLKAARVPERPEEYWEDFPRRVSVRLRTAPVRRRVEPRWQPRLAWGAGAAFACLVIGFAIGQWHGRPRPTDPYAALQSEKMLREVLTFFPNRVRAIVQDERGLHLVLSDKPDVPVSTPLWIKVCDGNQCRAVVTFSGQELQIARERVEVLADAQGGVMLVGDRLFWSSAEPDRAPGRLRIQSRPLAYAL
jgi:hypothetical protein